MTEIDDDALDAANRFVKNATKLRDGFKAYFDRLAPIGEHTDFFDLWVEVSSAKKLDGAGMAKAVFDLLSGGIGPMSGRMAAQQFVRIGCTFIAQAEGYYFVLKDVERSWYLLGQASYWLGLLTGREFGVEEQKKGNATSAMKRLQDARHAETRSMRAEAMSWYDEHRSEFKSDQAVAKAISELMPLKARTVAAWIIDHKKATK